MTDDDIIDVLRRESRCLGPADLAVVLRELTEDGLSPGTVITFFKRAFPEIPLRTIIEASIAGSQVGETQMDATFNAMLAEWLPRRGEGSSPSK